MRGYQRNKPSFTTTFKWENLTKSSCYIPTLDTTTRQLLLLDSRYNSTSTIIVFRVYLAVVQFFMFSTAKAAPGRGAAVSSIVVKLSAWLVGGPATLAPRLHPDHLFPGCQTSDTLQEVDVVGFIINCKDN
ncbi:hypothetical protein Ac2012v2_004657 [Leucoagaricus gongylophorus]